MNPELLQLVARISVERMFYCLIEGSALALLAWLLLRMLPRRNSGTRFAVWFSVLVAMVLLPFIGHSWGNSSMTAMHDSSGTALLTLPARWALYVFAAWMLIAMALLARVAAGLWQIRRLRRTCAEISYETLHPEVRRVFEQFRGSRQVTLCSSERIDVPTAIGFFNPAVVVPSWLLQEAKPGELRQVLLHELTHLRRRDDWTNLVQKIVKALLFFHPSVWWIEQRLSLEREMACDDAVLAQTASPRDYAACLAHMAEKSFVRRQMALAQAAVDRMRQLSLRVAQILDANRPGSTRLWKPAVPLVAVAAFVCVFSAGQTPELISFEDNSRAATNIQQQAGNSGYEQKKAVHAVAAASPVATQPRMVLAAERSAASPAKMKMQKDAVRSTRRVKPAVLTPTRERRAPAPRMLQANSAVPTGDYYVQQQSVTVTLTKSGQTVWQVRTWEVRLRLPESQARKPVPRKST